MSTKQQVQQPANTPGARKKSRAVCVQLQRPIIRDYGRLGETDRHLLDTLLADHLEYIDHEEFANPGVENDLYGSSCSLAEGTNYFRESKLLEQAMRTGRQGSTLSGEEEALLFKQYNLARKRIVGILAACGGCELPFEQLRSLIAWGHRATMARGQLAQANIGLVAAMAGKVRLAGLDYDEAVSAGNMALLRSIEKFDVSLGFKFSTYACQAIRQHMLSAAKRANRYHNRFTTEYDEAMELSDYNERKVDQVELDCVDELMDILKDNRASLSQTEREVLCKRFALSSQDRRPAPMTLKQIGELIGVTKESVRQIQKRALRKLRLALEREYLAA